MTGPRLRCIYLRIPREEYFVLRRTADSLGMSIEEYASSLLKVQAFKLVYDELGQMVEVPDHD